MIYSQALSGGGDIDLFIFRNSGAGKDLFSDFFAGTDKKRAFA